MFEKDDCVRKIISTFAMAALLGGPLPAFAKKEADDKSSSKKAQDRGTADIPVCTRKLGTIAIVEPETKWWTELGLSNPEAIIKFFVAKSGCFGLVDRGGGLAARAVVVLDANDNVLHAELVPEIKQEPDYAAALSVLA